MSSSLRIVFMGTPDFAVESLKALHESRHSVAGVVTAPDKPAGRGKLVESSPVKKYAEQAGLNPILQPSNLKDPQFLEQLASLKADIQLVVAFRMLPEIVWAMTPKGTLNLHASLLPDYRGAAPINWAIINGEKETGITTFFIEKEIDTGNIIFQEKVEITSDMDAGELHDILMRRGALLVIKTLNAIADNSFSVVSQEEKITDRRKTLHPAPKIFKDDCRINWKIPAEQIYNFIRGLSPYPAAWTEIRSNDNVIADHSHVTGDIFSDKKTYLKIAVSKGFISIESLQQAGKKRMEIKEFLRGFQSLDNYRLLV
jgi:methionyl-tRNA formyltransferase